MKCYKSRWIITGEGGVLENTALVVDEGKIIDLVPNDKVDFDPKFVKQ